MNPNQLVLNENLRLAWKNALAYFVTASLTQEKKFYNIDAWKMYITNIER